MGDKISVEQWDEFGKKCRDEINIREATVGKVEYYCEALQSWIDNEFNEIVQNMDTASSLQISSLIQLRARRELCKEIIDIIKKEKKDWDILEQ